MNRWLPPFHPLLIRTGCTELIYGAGQTWIKQKMLCPSSLLLDLLEANAYIVQLALLHLGSEHKAECTATERGHPHS